MVSAFICINPFFFNRQATVDLPEPKMPVTPIIIWFKCETGYLNLLMVILPTIPDQVNLRHAHLDGLHVRAPKQ